MSMDSDARAKASGAMRAGAARCRDGVRKAGAFVGAAGASLRYGAIGRETREVV